MQCARAVGANGLRRPSVDVKAEDNPAVLLGRSDELPRPAVDAAAVRRGRHSRGVSGALLRQGGGVHADDGKEQCDDAKADKATSLVGVRHSDEPI